MDYGIVMVNLNPRDKIVVSPDGSTGFATIQAAVDAASDGMMIEIMPGTYTENIRIGNYFAEKHIALAGIADDTGKFPTITAADKGRTVITIYGNVKLYRLNIETGVTTPNDFYAVIALSDSFVYSELNFDGRISVTASSGNFEKDCEVSNCTITRKIIAKRADGLDWDASNFHACCSERNATSFVKVRDCNFEKGEFILECCDIENCAIGVATACIGHPFSCKNSTIKVSKYLDDCDYDKFVNCKFLDK